MVHLALSHLTTMAKTPMNASQPIMMAPYGAQQLMTTQENTYGGTVQVLHYLMILSGSNYIYCRYTVGSLLDEIIGMSVNVHKNKKSVFNFGVQPYMWLNIPDS